MEFWISRAMASSFSMESRRRESVNILSAAVYPMEKMKTANASGSNKGYSGRWKKPLR
jgi:hypothetical protein